MSHNAAFQVEIKGLQAEIVPFWEEKPDNHTRGARQETHKCIPYRTLQRKIAGNLNTDKIAGSYVRPIKGPKSDS
jgi:hypothetical protein